MHPQVITIASINVSFDLLLKNNFFLLIRSSFPQPAGPRKTSFLRNTFVTYSINNTLFLSFIVFLTNIIPYFGPFIGAVFPIAMTLIYSPIKALWVALFLLILQQLDGNLIGPKVMGDQVGLNPLWIISAVLIGGSLFGIIGVFLSVPIAAIIKFSIDKYVQNKIHIRIQR